nr:immunoglobulin heavy chain junction region [Mus musculus]
CARFTMDYW